MEKNVENDIVLKIFNHIKKYRKKMMEAVGELECSSQLMYN